jgi:hypothetical protein
VKHVKDFLRGFVITLYSSGPRDLYLYTTGLYLFTAGEWDIHVVSYSPQTLMMHGEWMTQGKAPRKIW